MKRIKRRAPAKIYTHPRETLAETFTKQIAAAEAQLAIAPSPELEEAIQVWRSRLAQLTSDRPTNL